MTEDQVPIWGFAGQQCERGGFFNPNDAHNPKSDDILWNEKGTPRKPRQGREFYPGEFLMNEPDPVLSTAHKYGQHYRAMWRAGWTQEQIHEHSMTDCVVSAYYRYRVENDQDSGEAFSAYLWENSTKTDTKAYYKDQVESSFQCNSVFLCKKNAITLKEVENITQWLRENQGRPQKDLIAANVVHPRKVRKVLAHMYDQGLIELVEQRIPGVKGRTPKFWIIAGTQLIINSESFKPAAKEQAPTTVKFRALSNEELDLNF